MAAMRRLRQVASHVDHAGTVEPSRTAAKGEEVDLVIRDVTIVDGTGSDAFVGDVAVSERNHSCLAGRRHPISACNPSANCGSH